MSTTENVSINEALDAANAAIISATSAVDLDDAVLAALTAANIEDDVSASYAEMADSLEESIGAVVRVVALLRVAEARHWVLEGSCDESE